MTTKASELKPNEEWVKAVRDALTRLYDAAHLQGHVLQGLLDVPAVGGGGTARGLRRVLLDAIEALRPPAHVAPTAREWRAYRVLYERYVQRVPPLEVARALAISERQYQREHARALEAVAALLQGGSYGAADPLMATAVGGGRAGATTGGGIGREGAGTAPTPMGDVERLVAGAQREVLDAGQLVRGVVDDVEALAAWRGVSIWLDARVRARVHGDRGVVRQALLGIATFYVGHCTGGSLTVRLAVDEAAGRGGDVVFEFRAQPALRGLMVDPDATDSERLHLAGRLVRAAGGYVRCKDGALYVGIPSADRVLMVVDDNPDLVGLLRRYVAGEGYRLVGVTRPDKALDRAQEVRPFLVLLDVMMPSHDGWEILQALKHHPDTRVIPVAVCSVLDEPELAASLGADDFCRKPVSRQALLRLVRRWDEGSGRA